MRFIISGNPIFVTGTENAAQWNISAAERGKKAMENLEAYSKDPERIGQELLFKILRDNENTEYGKKVGFSDVKTVEDYKNNIPFTTYDDYSDYVARELAGKEEHLYSAYDVAQYNRSSGTAGTIKKIPMSSVSKGYLIDYAFAMPYGMAAKRFGDDFLMGKALSVAEVSVADVTGAERHSSVSGQGMYDWQVVQSKMFTSPVEAVIPEADTDSRYLHARYGLACKDVSSLQTTFITFLLDMFNYIRGNWAMLCRDIATGSIDPSVKMPKMVRSKLTSELLPMPERAEELRRIFSEGFDNTVAKRIWPNLAFIMGISTGTFSTYLRKLRENYVSADVPAVMIGVTVSEGAISAPYDFDTPDFVPLGHTMFMEFLPLGEEDPSKTCTISEVEIGKDYEIIITTQSGLYRYRTRDAVRFVKMYNSLPTMEYLYRIDLSINLDGEKTYEADLKTAMDAVAEDLGFEYVNFCVYPDADVSPPRYRFFIECSRRPKTKLKVVSVRLQNELIKVNPILEYLFSRRILGPVEIHLLKKGTYALWTQQQALLGGSSAQTKSARIILNDKQLEFFRTFVDITKQ